MFFSYNCLPDLSSLFILWPLRDIATFGRQVGPFPPSFHLFILTGIGGGGRQFPTQPTKKNSYSKEKNIISHCSYLPSSPSKLYIKQSFTHSSNVICQAFSLLTSKYNLQAVKKKSRFAYFIEFGALAGRRKKKSLRLLHRIWCTCRP